jgi:hypothetical protein
MTFTRMLTEARVGHDYLTQVSASSSQSEQHKALCRMLDERMILLGLQETHLGVHEAILVEELECGLRHPDGHDPPVELDETRALVHVIVGEQDAEAGRL